MPALLVGASARDLLLSSVWGRTMHRATVDVDLGFKARSWEAFEELQGRLLDSGLFRRDPKERQRLIYHGADSPSEILVDLIPFGGVEAGEQRILWPPDGDFELNVAGFEDPLASALDVVIQPGLRLAITSLPGLAALKLIAWGDRQRDRDAKDLSTILHSYAAAGNEDRLYEDELDVLERAEYDLECAGAILLGRDVRGAVSGAANAFITELLLDPRRAGAWPTV